jgi:hypothetical protein
MDLDRDASTSRAKRLAKQATKIAVAAFYKIYGFVPIRPPSEKPLSQMRKSVKGIRRPGSDTAHIISRRTW